MVKVMQGHEERHGWLPEAEKSKETNSSLGASGRNAALLTLWFLPSETHFGLLMSRSVRESICVVLNHKICGNLLQQRQETKTVFLLNLGLCPSHLTSLSLHSFYSLKHSELSPMYLLTFFMVRVLGSE